MWSVCGQYAVSAWSVSGHYSTWGTAQVRIWMIQSHIEVTWVWWMRLWQDTGSWRVDGGTGRIGPWPIWPWAHWALAKCHLKKEDMIPKPGIVR